MAYWLLLADPESYGFNDLVKDRRTVWDGISGAPAQRHLRDFKEGDQALVYHTSPDKAVMGRARVVSAPYPDPADPTGKRVALDLEATNSFAQPVPVAALRENPNLSDMMFLKIQRMAVSPLTRSQFEEIIRMGKGGR